jgi:hypothetical protein
MSYSTANLFKTTVIALGFCLLGSQSAIAAETYKLELKESTSKAPLQLQGESFKRIRGQSEWAVLKVLEPRTVKFQHMRRTANNYGVSRWTENAVTTVVACPIVAGDCTTISGNRFELPKLKTVKDFSFEFQFVENEVKQARSFQVPSDRLPETQSRPNDRSISPKR